MDVLEIKYKVRDSWGNVRSEGHINLLIKGFFPCTKTEFKKLLQIIEMSEQKDEILTQLELALPERIEQLKKEEADSMALAKEYARDYFSETQKAADLKLQLKSGKYPNGVTIPVYLRANMKDQLKDHKARAKYNEDKARDKLYDAKRAVKNQTRMGDLIHYLAKYLQMG